MDELHHIFGLVFKPWGDESLQHVVVDVVEIFLHVDEQDVTVGAILADISVEHHLEPLAGERRAALFH